MPDTADRNWRVWRRCSRSAVRCLPDTRQIEKGEYDARIIETVITGGAGPRCLFLEFLPPEASELRSVSINSMRIHVYGTPDLETDALFRSDTLFIDVVLPPEAAL